MSIGESHFRHDHALNLLEVMFRSPEAAPCKVNIPRGFCFQNPVHFMLYEWPGLTLQQNTRLQAFQPVPDILGNIHTITATLLTDDRGLH